MLRPLQRTLLALTLTFGCRATTRIMASPPRLEAVRFWSFGDVTRIAIQTLGPYRLTTDQIAKPPRLYFDLTGLRPPLSAHRGLQTISVGDKLLKQIRIAEVSPGKTRVVFDLEIPVEVVSSQLVNPDRLMIELRPKHEVSGATSVATLRPPSLSIAAPGARPYFQSHPPIGVVSIQPQAALVLADLPPWTSLASKLDGKNRPGLVTSSTALTSVHPLPIPKPSTSLRGDAAMSPAARTRD